MVLLADELAYCLSLSILQTTESQEKKISFSSQGVFK